MVKTRHPYLNTQFHDQSRLVSVVPCSLLLTLIVTWLLKYRSDVVWSKWKYKYTVRRFIRNQIINIPSKHFHPHQISDGEDKLRGLPTKSTKSLLFRGKTWSPTCWDWGGHPNPQTPTGPLAQMRCLLAFTITWTHYKVVSTQNSAPSTLQEAL